jgi:hypothetical protein
MLTQAFRDAVRQGGDAELQSALRSLIARLPLELSFKVACEQLSAFLPTFEEGASNVAWIRRFLEGAETSFGGTEAVTQPVAFELEEDRYSFAGAGNYINGLEELWLAMSGRANREEYERWVFESLFS